MSASLLASATQLRVVRSSSLDQRPPSAEAAMLVVAEDPTRATRIESRQSAAPPRAGHGRRHEHRSTTSTLEPFQPVFQGMDNGLHETLAADRGQLTGQAFCLGFFWSTRLAPMTPAYGSARRSPDPRGSARFGAGGFEGAREALRRWEIHRRRAADQKQKRPEQPPQAGSLLDNTKIVAERQALLPQPFCALTRRVWAPGAK